MKVRKHTLALKFTGWGGLRSSMSANQSLSAVKVSLSVPNPNMETVSFECDQMELIFGDIVRVRVDLSRQMEREFDIHVEIEDSAPNVAIDDAPN